MEQSEDPAPAEGYKKPTQSDKENIISKLPKRLTFDQLNDIHVKYKGFKLEKEGGDEDVMQIYMNEDDEKDFLEILCHTSLPDMKEIAIYKGLESDADSISIFLKKSMPNKLKTIGIVFNEQLKISKYLLSFTTAAKSVTYNFGFSQLIISQKEFELLIAATAHCEMIGFCSSTIDTDDECDFSAVKSSNLALIDLSKTCTNSQWKEHPDRFVNLLKGIKNCAAIKKSLKKLAIDSEVYSTKDEDNKVKNDLGLKSLELYYYE